MIEIQLNHLSKENFYKETLDIIEKICDDYSLITHFGILSMSNQMVSDYLDTLSYYDIDVSFIVDVNEVSFSYFLQSGTFKPFSEITENGNTGFYVLKQLADEVSFTSDYNELTASFHVKTKIRNTVVSLSKQSCHKVFGY